MLGSLKNIFHFFQINTNNTGNEQLRKRMLCIHYWSSFNHSLFYSGSEIKKASTRPKPKQFQIFISASPKSFMCTSGPAKAISVRVSRDADSERAILIPEELLCAVLGNIRRAAGVFCCACTSTHFLACEAHLLEGTRQHMLLGHLRCWGRQES